MAEECTAAAPSCPAASATACRAAGRRLRATKSSASSTPRNSWHRSLKLLEPRRRSDVAARSQAWRHRSLFCQGIVTLTRCQWMELSGWGSALGPLWGPRVGPRRPAAPDRALAGRQPAPALSLFPHAARLVGAACRVPAPRRLRATKSDVLSSPRVTHGT